MTLKTAKILYRVSTILLAAFILPGLFFMNSELAQEGMKAVLLENVTWLKPLLGYASPLAILGILIESFYSTTGIRRLKEWAYAGISFIYIGAFRAHYSLGHSTDKVIMPVVTFAILMVSYFCRHRLVDKA